MALGNWKVRVVENDMISFANFFILLLLQGEWIRQDEGEEWWLVPEQGWWIRSSALYLSRGGG